MALIENILKALPGVGSAIASIFDTSNSASTQRQNIDRTIQANKEMAEYQYSKDLEMWNRGNLYNAPSAQMQRLKEAGLNPNLVYGSGGATTVAGQLPKYNAPTMNYNYQPPTKFAEMLGSFQDMQIKQAQLDNLRAQRSAINQETVNKGWLAQLLEQREMMGRTARDYYPDEKFEALERMRIENSLKRGLAPHQLNYMEGRNTLQGKQINKLVAETEYKKLQNEWYQTQMWGKMGLDLLNIVPKVFNTRMQNVVPRINPKNAVRYNSPTSWKNAGY